MKKVVIITLIILTVLSISFSIVYATNTANTSNNTNTSNIENLTNNVKTPKTDISNSVSESKNIKIKTSIGGKNFYVYLDNKEYELYQKNGFFYDVNKHFYNSDEMIRYLQENYKVEEIK